MINILKGLLIICIFFSATSDARKTGRIILILLFSVLSTLSAPFPCYSTSNAADANIVYPPTVSFVQPDNGHISHSSALISVFMIGSMPPRWRHAHQWTARQLSGSSRLPRNQYFRLACNNAGWRCLITRQLQSRGKKFLE